MRIPLKVKPLPLMALLAWECWTYHLPPARKTAGHLPAKTRVSRRLRLLTTEYVPGRPVRYRGLPVEPSSSLRMSGGDEGLPLLTLGRVPRRPVRER